MESSRPARVLVYGAGAVGSFLGGLLADAGSDVTLLGRPALGHAVQESGLTLDRPEKTVTVYPQFAESTEQLTDTPDIVVLTVRTYDVGNALPDLREILNRSTNLVTVENGIGTDEVVRDALPGTPILAASLTLSAEWAGPASARSTSQSGGLSLAPVACAANPQPISNLFRSTGITVTQPGDYRSMKWSKLLLNMMGNATSAILDRPPGKVYADPDLFLLERQMLLEAVDVIHAEGSRLVKLPGFSVPLLAWALRSPPMLGRRLLSSRVSGGRGAKMPSLWKDIDAGRERTEANWLYGAVVENGAKHGVPTPVNRRLLRIIEAVTVNRQLREAFRNRPDRLLRSVVLGMKEPRVSAPGYTTEPS